MTRLLPGLTALTLFAGACVPLSSHEATIVRAWMTCFECTVERDSLQALGQRKPQALIDSLAPRLLTSPILPLAFSGTAQTAFIQDSVYRSTHGMPMSPLDRAQYVQEESRRYVEGQRVRAAAGLGYMHTPGATAVLDQALALGLSPELQRLIRYARDSLP